MFRISSFSLLFLLIFPSFLAHADYTRSPVIFIPGILGSKLKVKNTNEVRWGALSAVNKEGFEGSILDPLNKRKEELEAYEVMEDFDLFPIPFKIPVYSPTINYLRDKLGFVDNINLFLFPYDWRKNPDDAAALLVNKMEEWSRLPSVMGRKFTIIAHSLGGLVAELAINKQGGDKYTKMLITLASPIRGSPIAFQILNEGLTKESFGIDINEKIGSDLVKESIFWNPSTYALLTHDGVSSFYLLDEKEKGEKIDSTDLFPFFNLKGGIRVIEDIDVSSDDFMEQYVKFRFAKDGECSGDCERRLKFVKDELKKSRELWRFISLDSSHQSFKTIPRFRILSSDTDEATTLHGYLVSVLQSVILSPIKSSRGDGTVVPESTMTVEEYSKYSDLNSRFRVFVDPVTGVIDTFSVDSPKFMYYYQKYKNYKPTCIFPYGEFLATFSTSGIPFDKFTSFKIVNSKHETIISKMESHELIAHILSNSENSFVSAPLSDGTFYSFFAQYENLESLKPLVHSRESIEKVVTSLLTSALTHHVDYSYKEIPVVALNWIREIAQRNDKIKFRFGVEGGSKNGRIKINLMADLYEIDNNKPVTSVTVTSESSTAELAIEDAFLKSFIEIDRRSLKLGNLFRRKLPPIDYRFRFPDKASAVVASLDVVEDVSYFQSSTLPSNLRVYSDEDFELNVVDYNRILTKSFDETLISFSPSDKRSLLEKLEGKIGGRISRLNVVTKLKYKNSRYYYFIKLMLYDLDGNYIDGVEDESIQAHYSGGKNTYPSLSLLRSDHIQAVKSVWRKWLFSLL